jgi:sulfate transport system ATP-binding protein
MSIILENLTKRYDGHPVVYNVSLEISEGEFFVLLGPSGSGKSTILNMIAGLAEVEQGRVWLHGRDVTFLPPQARQVGFVFQNYALFQHMSVADNIEFGLRVRKVPVAERRRRRDELLELVGLAGLGGRMPHQLSGGQQQRVALARALAHRPEVLLLDEPLGALDAKIRAELRRTLRTIQGELGLTTILVTHDQEEAFELADRLGVMSFGRLLEVGPPQELYHCPQTEFVATFLGTANLLVGERCEPKGVQVGPACFPIGPDAGQIGGYHRVQVLFRPEDVELGSSPQALTSPQLGPGEVEQTTFVGSFERLRLRLPPIPAVRPIAPPVAFGGGTVIVEATRSPDQVNQLPLQPGDKVWVGVRRIHALAHPGLNFLIVTNGSPQVEGALALGGQMARLAHARLTLLGYGQSPAALQRHLQRAKEKLGSGLASLEIRATVDPLALAVMAEVERQTYDLVVLGFQRQESVELAEQILQTGDHHLLLVSQPQPTPARALICVASGEPGKADVLFAGRLVRHVGAEATLLSVLSEEENEARSRAERFLAGGVRTLQLLGVPARAAIRSGPVRDEITREVTAGGYDLLVLGAPLPARDGKISLAGVVGQILNVMNRPVLIVRSGV